MGKPLYKPAIYQRQLKLWTPERVTKWKRTRERGALRFFATYIGAMLGATLLLMVGLQLYISRSLPSLMPLGAGLAVGFPIGFFFTWNIWRSNEALYKMAVEKTEQSEAL